MRAAQVVARGRVQLVEAPVPAMKPGHALVRTMLLALCGSDIHMLHYLPDDAYPCVVGSAGHERVGTIEDTDAPGGGTGVGDAVLALAPRQDAMAEYFLARVEDVLPLPEGPRLEHLLMAQQLGTVVYACRRLPSAIGRDVAVIGQGPAGLFFDALLRRMGARWVIGLDVKEARVAAGLRFGATHVVNSERVDAVEAVEEITGGRLADVVVEAAGEVDTVNLAAKLVKVGGRLLYFGVPRGRTFGFDFWTFYRKYCDTASVADAPSEPGRESFRLALRWIAGGEIDVSSLITHHFPFERLTEAYELVRTREEGAIKVVVEMAGYRQLN